MVSLGDYLGHLLAEVTHARAQSDVETVRVAELYSNHELLKHFPVPRIRIRDIDFDIPVLIIRDDSVDPDPDALSPPTLLKKFSPLLKRRMRAEGIQISQAQDKELQSLLSAEATRFVRPRKMIVDTNLVADGYTKVAGKYLKSVDQDETAVDRLSAQLRRESRAEFVNARPEPPKVMVGVTSTELQEAQPDSITRISLRITEEGVEWTSITTDAGDEDRLIPE